MKPFRAYLQRRRSSTVRPARSLLKDQSFPSGLWVIGTPLGNLSDLSPRAEMALSIADMILCEDTRRTATLLSALSISNALPRLRRFDDYTPQNILQNWVHQLKLGQNLALVTDAGTPCISDPGWSLISLAKKENILVSPIPGPSAVTALLSVSGFSDSSFSFKGFFPRKPNEQKNELSKAQSCTDVTRIFVWFEAPSRITSTLEAIYNFDPNLDMVVGKEITKIHESFFYGTSTNVLQQIIQQVNNNGALGEWCFAIKFPVLEKVKDSSWKITLKCLINSKISVQDSVKQVCEGYEMSKKEVYNFAIEYSKSLKDEPVNK